MPAIHPRPWHRGSIYGDGPRRPLDRDERARFRFLLRAHARARRLSAKAQWVGQALLQRLSANGRCDPAQATLADDAGCSERTVRRALAAMRDLGLIRWVTRLVRADWRAEQTSNAYELVPTAPVPKAAARCGGQSGRETKPSLREGFSYLLLTAEQTAAQAALARIAKAREGVLWARR